MIGRTTGGAIVYTIGLLALYLFRFGEWEAVRLASYERYLGTYWTGVVLFVALVTIWLVAGTSSSEQIKGSKRKSERVPEMVLAASVFVFIFALSPAQKLGEFFANPNGYSSQVRALFEPLLENAEQAGVQAGDKVWIIAQHTNGFEYWVLRYSLMGSEVNPNGWSIGSPASDEDIWTLGKSPSDWAQNLWDYDYVLIYALTDSFATEFEGVFDVIPDIGSPHVYKVAGDGPDLLLTKVS